MNKELKIIGHLFLEFIESLGKGSAREKDVNDSKSYLNNIFRHESNRRKSYTELIEKIENNENFKNKISKNTIVASIGSIVGIQENLNEIKTKTPEQVGAELIKKIKEDNSSKHYLVINILEGFLSSRELIKIGNINFGLYRNIVKLYKIPEMEKPNVNDRKYKDKSSIYKIKQMTEKEVENVVSVGTLVEAYDTETAIRIAKNKINESINLLRLIIPLENSIFRKPKISISEVFITSRAYVIRKEDGYRYNPYIKQGERQQRMSIFFLDGDLQKFGIKKAFKNATNLILKEEQNRSELENRIIKALTWIGEAIDSEDWDLKIIKFRAGLDTLLPEKYTKKRGKAKLIKELCNKIANYDKTKSQEINNALLKTKELRNHIIHGEEKIVNYKDAEFADCFGAICLLKIFEEIPNLDNINKYLLWLKEKE